MKIAIFYIAIGKYDVFFDAFYKSCEKYFIENTEKTYFVFTDSENIVFNKSNICKIPTENMGWPNNTLKRFHLFCSVEEQAKENEYCFFLNANIEFMTPLTQEILPSQGIVVTRHPGYYKLDREDFPYERNEKSLAYIPYGTGAIYVCGGVNGGKTEDYYKMCHTLKERVDIDYTNGVVAKWHDESHINRYILELEKHEYMVWHPGFCYPDFYDMPFNQKCHLREKEYYIDLPKQKKNHVPVLGKIYSFLFSEQRHSIMNLNRFKRKYIRAKQTGMEMGFFVDNSKVAQMTDLYQNCISTTSVIDDTKVRFSVIVPMYKTVPYLDKCFLSILGQDFKDFELIIVDDGCPDGGGIIAEQYANKDKRIKVIHKENGGLDSARKEGMKQASGQYLVFLDSDDSLTDGTLGRIDKKLQELNNNVDILQCGYRYIFGDGRTREMREFEKIFGDREVITSREFMINHFKHHDSFWNVWSKVYKRSYLESIEFGIEPKYAVEDVIFLVKWCLPDCKVSYLNEIHVDYLAQRVNSIMNVKTLNLLYGHLYSGKKVMDLLIKSDLNAEDKKFMTGYFSKFFLAYCLQAESFNNTEQRQLLYYAQQNKYIFKYLPKNNPIELLFGMFYKFFGVYFTCNIAYKSKKILQKKYGI